MTSEVCDAQQGDIPAIARCWNGLMVHDTMSEAELQRALFGVEAAVLLVAHRGDEVTGLVCGVPATSRGSRGHIIAVCAASASEAADLLGRAEERLARLGVTHIVASEFGANPLAPGTDVRYEHLHAGFAQAGFERTHTLDDMELCLPGYKPTDYQRQASVRMEAYGARVVRWSDDLAPVLQRFPQAAESSEDLPAGWFLEGWDEGPNMVIAFKDGEAIGWANYDPDLTQSFGRYHRPNAGAFGPTGVLEEHRGHGVGTCILVETSLAAKRAGREWLWAGWTNTPFYIPNDWTICRQFAVWEKGSGKD